GLAVVRRRVEEQPPVLGGYGDGAGRDRAPRACLVEDPQLVVVQENEVLLAGRLVVHLPLAGGQRGRGGAGGERDTLHLEGVAKGGGHLAAVQAVDQGRRRTDVEEEVPVDEGLDRVADGVARARPGTVEGERAGLADRRGYRAAECQGVDHGG